MPGCLHCGTELRKPPTGPFPKYCSGKCRAGASNDRRRADGRYVTANARRLKPKITKTCPYCLSEFETARPEQVRCSGSVCVRAHAAKLQRVGKYVTNYRRKSGRNPGSLAADARRRNARVIGEPFHRRDVFERDGWLCWLCDESVDPAATFPDPVSASVDHVVPVSLGGVHSIDNVRLAHLGCNCSRGNRLAS